jgi:5'-nucleotidase
MRNILITNDDGIFAGGIVRLAKTAQAFGRVFVIAPETQRSAASHSISLHSPIDIFPAEFPVPGVTAFACSGTPGDCVRLGCTTLLPAKPDAVLSGINFGYNAASDIQYSATAGAAFEGAFQGCLSIAFSEGTNNHPEVADRFLPELLAELLELPASDSEIINVNFPGCPLAECRGILRDRTVSHSMIFRDTYRAAEQLPGGGTRYEVVGEYHEEAEPGTDLRALFDKYVSVGRVCNVGWAGQQIGVRP